MKNTLLLFVLLFSLKIQAQTNTKTKRVHHFSAQWLGWTFHPGGGSMPQNYPWKLDERANNVLNLGVALSYDWAWKRHIFWRIAGGYYADCAALPAGYIHIGFRWEALRFGRHTFNGGFGPGFLFRKDWHQFTAYRGDNIYGERVYQGWQYRLTPVIGEVEYLFKINEKLQLQYSVLPAYPAAVVSKMGIRWHLR
jgi:hypothetical protein